VLRDLYEVEFDLPAETITYREGLRRVRMRCSWLEEVILHPESASWWEQGEFRDSVSAAEREIILQRVVQAALRERVQLRVDQPPGGVAVTLEMPGEGGTYHVPKSPAQVRTILNWIAEALAFIEPQAEAGLEPAQSITRQLHWCRATLLGEPAETPPGPLTMGERATREYDMWGNDPEFARLVWKIQDAMQGI